MGLARIGHHGIGIYRSVRHPGNHRPPNSRGGAAWDSLWGPLGIGWALLGLEVFRRGALDLKFDTAVANGWRAGRGMMVTLWMVFAPNNIVGLRMILSGLVFLVTGEMFLIRHIIEQSELKTREKLLEVEYRLAELADRMQSEQARPPTPRV